MTARPVDLGQAQAFDGYASHRVLTRFGIEFDARDDWWPIDGRAKVHAAGFRTLVGPSLRDGLERTMRHAARRYSLATMQQFVYSLRHYRKTMCADQRIVRWTLPELRSYRALLVKEFGHEDCLRHLRSLLSSWFKARLQGVSEEVFQGLSEMKLKGAESGRAVRVNDPEKGPLTPDELHHLSQGLNDAAESGSLSLEDFSLGYFHVCTGRRPIQSAQLKCKDVVETLGEPEREFPDGRLLHLLAVPRAKQKGHAFRETRRAIDLTAQNFLVFKAQRDSVRETFARLLEANGWDLQTPHSEHLSANLPLFPAWSAIEKCVLDASKSRSTEGHGTGLALLQEAVAGNALHRSPNEQAKHIARICTSVNSFDRDGAMLQVSASRLRYTKGTDLSREGLPAHVVAWIMDHSTSRSSNIYIDNLPEHGAQIDQAISKSLTLQRFAAAFRGTLVDSEADAVGGDQPQKSRIAVEGRSAATCGHLKQCGLDEGIPRACYTCFHFQPWVDGPHAEFLAVLLTERAVTVGELGAASPVAKRADKLIAAVENVIERCKSRRVELATDLVKGRDQ